MRRARWALAAGVMLALADAGAAVDPLRVLPDGLIDSVRALPAPELATADPQGVHTPLSKSLTRADGLTLAVVAPPLAQATLPHTRNAFARIADRYLLHALRTLPGVPPASPQAAGQATLRLGTADGWTYLASWRADAPFPARGVAHPDACARLLPPFDPPGVRPTLPGGWTLRIELQQQRSHQAQQMRRSMHWDWQAGDWLPGAGQCTDHS